MCTTLRLRAARPIVGMTTLRPCEAQEEFAAGSQRMASVIIFAAETGEEESELG